MLGEFVWVALACLGHKQQDLWGLWDGMHSHSDRALVYTLIWKCCGITLCPSPSPPPAWQSRVQTWMKQVGWPIWKQHASVSQGSIGSDTWVCCHTEIETADQTCHFIQWQYQAWDLRMEKSAKVGAWGLQKALSGGPGGNAPGGGQGAKPPEAF